MRRIETMRLLQPLVGDDLVIVGIDGNANDWHQLRPHGNFYMGHSMGLTTGIALGLALARPDQRIWTFEGDGSMLMNLGLLGVLGTKDPPNLRVLIFDNEIYEGGGGRNTLTRGTVDLAGVATGCGIRSAATARTPNEAVAAVEAAVAHDGTAVVVIKIEAGVDGPPLMIDGPEAKLRFVRHVEAKLGISIVRPAEDYSAMVGWSDA